MRYTYLNAIMSLLNLATRDWKWICGAQDVDKFFCLATIYLLWLHPKIEDAWISSLLVIGCKKFHELDFLDVAY